MAFKSCLKEKKVSQLSGDCAKKKDSLNKLITRISSKMLIA